MPFRITAHKVAISSAPQVFILVRIMGSPGLYQKQIYADLDKWHYVFMYAICIIGILYPW